DYYVTPYEVGYGPFVRFDHEFIGREALEKMAAKPHRKKVTLAWEASEIARVQASLSDPVPYKYISLPNTNYTAVQYDTILLEGRQVGLSIFSCYSYNERTILSLSLVDPGIEIGA